MSHDAFLMLWRPEGGPTVVLPCVDEGGEMAPMAREIADVFDERGVSPDAAFWRMVAGDRAETIGAPSATNERGGRTGGSLPRDFHGKGRCEMRCWLGRHAFYVTRQFGADSRQVGCRRCSRLWAMNDRVMVFLPWDESLDDLYRSLGFSL